MLSQNSSFETLQSRRNQDLPSRKRSWNSRDDRTHISRERSLEHERNYQNQTVRDWTACSRDDRTFKSRERSLELEGDYKNRRVRNWTASCRNDQTFKSRERSLERERNYQNQTVRDWTACSRDDRTFKSRERSLELERNWIARGNCGGRGEYKNKKELQKGESNRIFRDFQSPTHGRRSEKSLNHPYGDRSLNISDRLFEFRRGRESYIEHDWDSLNVERDGIRKELHNQFDREQNFSEDCGHPSREEKSPLSEDYFVQETRCLRDDRVSFWGLPEDRFLRPSSPKCCEAETSPVRYFSSLERSHTNAQGTYRPRALLCEDRKNMFPEPSAANGNGRGFNSQGDLDVCLAKELVKRICSSGGELTLDIGQWEQFCRQVIGSVPSGNMDAFFHRFLRIFCCEPDPNSRSMRMLRVKTTLELCKDHCSNDGCKQLVCKGLHCCKFFLFGSCNFNQSCNFGHNLTDCHNRRLLAKHHLDMLTPPQIGALLKSGKASQVFLKVCRFYNVEGGCRHGDKGVRCHAMHVCRHYMLDDCKFGKNCKRSHDIYDEQPMMILKRHGIQVDRNQKQVLEELKAAMKENGCDDGDDYSDGEIRSSDSDESS